MAIKRTGFEKQIANLLSLSRVIGLFLVTCFLFLKFKYSQTCAFVSFIFFSITDALDGAVARSLGTVSVFGILFDAITDKVLTTGVLVTLLVIGEFPKWYLFPILLILSREFLVTGLRLVAAARNQVLSAEKHGKIKTALQMVSICIMLARRAAMEVVPLTKEHDLFRYLYWVGIGSFFGAALLTFLSGIIYFTKYSELFLDDDQTAALKTKRKEREEKKRMKMKKRAKKWEGKAKKPVA
ncbi:CDP-alcohol phosphatidyltransferase like protein [Aduncisulcus paluster]|uniref:CDP-alcohol phosphatidyltransferase like protein n=1 Tax=Aduncisulcus paluster TaxID=2918883 RepID=A0ABQ5KIW8_9EUKA|nr:CDP-alcohol phosphatidyltransferase like protein [Aduncisulcus paluster]|eukprot:gnl/Carplike_NY0171/1597_a2158_910.p1 GENE.gnl/Carplike_NY0171/1597_a2158_910~~gnl/Carplike_NY0171/1597_a2158_910.p1  ORF type:complete len:252 (-),score=46.12 gnl/Carplike_NY0171/1597_a2158_910:224-943(-)